MTSSLLRKLSSPFRRKRKKSESEVPMRPPGYRGRHLGRDALVLVTGPTIHTHLAGVRVFIREHRPLVIGCNNVPDGLHLDYHAYVNRKRFVDHGSKIAPEAALLLSPYFLESQIGAVTGDRLYELLMYRNRYPGESGSLRLEDGVVYAEGATVGPLACGAALAMGAKNLFVAGMDGYSISEQTHYYEEPDNKDRLELLEQERRTRAILADIASICGAADGRLRILTPTAYSDYYDASLLPDPPR